MTLEPLGRTGLVLLVASAVMGFCSNAHADGLSARQIRIQDEGLRAKVALALLEAWDRLETPACREAFGADYELTRERLAELTFLDGRDSRVCKSNPGVYAFTVLSSTQVTLCPRFGKDKDRAATLLHEAFHTQGVQEQNSVAGSQAITARVVQACR